MAINNFDPTKYGAKPFNPQQYGAKPVSGFPTEEPQEQQRSFLEKLGSITKGVGSALTTSEQKFGQALSTVFDHNSLNTVDQISQQETSGQQAIINAIQKETDPAKKQRLTEFLKTNYGADYQTPTATDLNPAFGMTNKEVIGAAAGTALDFATAGNLARGAKSFGVLKYAAPEAKAALTAEKALTAGEKLANVAKTTTKTAAAGALTGYGYDVVNDLQSNKSLKEAATPGWGTAIGATLPIAFGAYQAGKIGTKELASRIDNSLIKPLTKDFRYGKNPGRTMAELGIVANSQDELVKNLGTARQSVGAELGQTAQQIAQALDQANPVVLDLQTSLAPLDEAMKVAARNNDTTLLNRLQNTKKALIEELVPAMGADGNVIIESKGQRKIEGFMGALDLKRMVGEMTKWTGNPSEDKLINKALKEVYGKLDDSLTQAASTASPELAQQFEKLNGQYSDLITAEIAAKHTNELTQRQNLVSMPVKVGGAAGVITALATGGAAVPAILATVAAGTLDKALSSTAVKTRVAAWLAKESPGTIQKLLEKNPAVGKSLYNAFYEESDIPKTTLQMMKDVAKDIKKKGVPVGLSIEVRGADKLKAEELGKKINELNKQYVQKPTPANKKALESAVKMYRKLVKQ